MTIPAPSAVMKIVPMEPSVLLKVLEINSLWRNQELLGEDIISFKGPFLPWTGPEDLKIGELLKRLDKEGASEVIIATNPTTEGEATASFLVKLLSEKDGNLKITRIALGVPMGGDLKYMDRMTIEHALRSRMPINL